MKALSVQTVDQDARWMCVPTVAAELKRSHCKGLPNAFALRKFDMLAQTHLRRWAAGNGAESCRDRRARTRKMCQYLHLLGPEPEALKSLCHAQTRWLCCAPFINPKRERRWHSVECNMSLTQCGSVRQCLKKLPSFLSCCIDK